MAHVRIARELRNSRRPKWLLLLLSWLYIVTGIEAAELRFTNHHTDPCYVRADDGTYWAIVPAQSTVTIHVPDSAIPVTGGTWSVSEYPANTGRPDGQGSMYRGKLTVWISQVGWHNEQSYALDPSPLEAPVDMDSLRFVFWGFVQLGFAALIVWVVKKARPRSTVFEP